METLHITVSQAQGRVPVTLFRLNGRANLGTIKQLEAKAREAVEAGTRNLLLDLSEAPSVTSAGLRAIHVIYTLLRDASPEAGNEAAVPGPVEGKLKSPHLKLLNPSPDVLRVLEIAGYTLFLEIHDNLKDAIASF